MLRVGSNPRSSQQAAAPPDCGCGNMEILRCRFLLSKRTSTSLRSRSVAVRTLGENSSPAEAAPCFPPGTCASGRHARGDAFSRHSCQESQSSLHQSSYPAVSDPANEKVCGVSQLCRHPLSLSLQAPGSADLDRPGQTLGAVCRRLFQPRPRRQQPSGRAGALAGTSSPRRSPRAGSGCAEPPSGSSAAASTHRARLGERRGERENKNETFF